MNELDELRRHHDTMPEPDARTIDAARSRLNAHMRGGRDERPRQLRPLRAAWAPRAFWLRRALWAPLAGAAVALAVAVTVAPRQGEDPRPPQAQPPTIAELRLRPVANAQDVADNAALLAGGEPAWTAGPKQWGYVKSLRARTRTDGGRWLRGEPAKTSTHEQWRRLDDQAFATIERGKLTVHEGSEFEVTYPYLLALPADADRLLARIYETVDAEHARNRASMLERARQRAQARGRTPEEAARLAEEAPPPLTSVQRDRWAFQLIALGMGDAALPPRIRAAMYGAMAAIPGVRYEDGSSDLLDRRGITLYHVLDGYLRDEIFIDPRTYEYLGYRTIVVKNHKDGPFDTMRKGDIHNWDALVETAVVDRAGQRPG
ncbi:hypothetical protein [Nonomuraea gerenzanensis]|uniref:CU044_5270 family protein n=1 Tax=Nonomuraea gerenzanensis TaxID=93944 RepID=A0A1M4EBH1_9ACTN|nr:hypothetical protein [Nonomuraea gerenzanensis]UBU18143.1 hypothetical protein LCN96_24895 [Nonomuraea gerenzanensis]SBO95953.1 hypothetical protein BN4615_P5469 [Nonomuraea gerenzanensis]